MHYIADEAALESNLRASRAYAHLPVPTVAVAVLYAKRMLAEHMKRLQYTANDIAIQEVRGSVILRLFAAGYITASVNALPFAVIETYSRHRIADHTFDVMAGAVKQAIRVAPRFKGDSDWRAEYDIVRAEFRAAVGNDEFMDRLDDGSLSLGDVFQAIPAYFIPPLVLPAVR